MAVESAQITIGTNATKIVEAGPNGAVIVLHDPSAGSDVFIGDASVTTSNGYQMEGGDNTPAMPLYPNETLYGIVATGTQVLYVLAVHQ